MIYKKPVSLAHLKKGVLIGSIPGVVDTINWIISCFDNMKGKDDKKIEGLDDGNPVIVSGVTVEAPNGNTGSGQKIVLRSMSGSNVKFNVTTDSDNNVVVEIGAYWN